jgi:hypothetical protein
MRGRAGNTWIALAPLASLASLALAACSTATLDSAKAERQIESSAQQFTGQHVTASCPANIPESKGRVTRCTLTAGDGTKASAQVVQKDDNGNVSYSATLVATAGLEQQISRNATEQSGFPVKVTCPQLVEVTRAIQIDQCSASTAKGKTVAAPVTITNSGGQLNYHWHIG